ncbi:inositol monophosphatase [Candidatus Thorarchaeota archaeon]|nr:MAG: inositol monophosphatase [Candidatus Thorarchaeota archaeon]
MCALDKQGENKMNIERLLLKAADSAKRTVFENLQDASQRTGTMNPFGDKTLLLDKKCEETIVRTLADSGESFMVLTEEEGQLLMDENPDYIAIIDPIDGSANLERRIPLCSVGIAVLPYGNAPSTDDIECSVIMSLFTDETYVAKKREGVTRNGTQVVVRPRTPMEETIISYDTNDSSNQEFLEKSMKVVHGVRDIRRTASNLLDLCWVAGGGLDAMIDFRNILPIVHVSGTHMVEEAGGYVMGLDGQRLLLPIEMSQRMSFVAASNKKLAHEILSLFQNLAVSNDL